MRALLLCCIFIVVAVVAISAARVEREDNDPETNGTNSTPSTPSISTTNASPVNTVGEPETGLWLNPIPVSTRCQKQPEDRLPNPERYERVPILGPITSDGPPQALDPPSEAEVMATLPNAEGGLPFLDEIQRNKVRMTTELIAEYVDPPKFYPLIGRAQIHHAHYKCTVRYREIIRVGWPLPHTTVDEDQSKVIYIDHYHFHLVDNADDGVNTPYSQPLK